MIRLLSEGLYTLFATKRKTTILTLINSHELTFAWIEYGKIGEILVSVEVQQKPKKILSSGKYRLYSVEKEPKLTDLEHLELFVGNGKWQGYLLPTGLPSKKDKKNMIIPTTELITGSTL